MSFDPEHDRDLLDRLVGDSRVAGSGFAVCGSSREASPQDFVGEGARRAIRAADQMIVLCSERTDDSIAVSGELRIARAEGTPFTLVWGRREAMCTKPSGAEPHEAMYGWSREILQDRIRFVGRMAAREGDPAPPIPGAKEVPSSGVKEVPS